MSTQLKITLDDLNTIRSALTSGVIVHATTPDGIRPAISRAIDNVMIALMEHRSDVDRLSPAKKATKIRQLRRLLGYTYP